MTLFQTFFLVALVAAVILMVVLLLLGGRTSDSDDGQANRTSPMTRFREERLKRAGKEQSRWRNDGAYGFERREPNRHQPTEQTPRDRSFSREDRYSSKPPIAPVPTSSELYREMPGRNGFLDEMDNRPPVSLRSRSKLYHYTALVTDVYDGDTVTVDIDLGLNMWLRNQRIRLWKIDTPELRGQEREAGLKVRDLVRELVLNKYVLLRTILDKRGQDQTGKYGRLLGELLLEEDGGEVINVNDYLLAKGLAVPFGIDGSAIVPNTAPSAPRPSAASAPEGFPSPASAPTGSVNEPIAPQQGTIHCPYCGDTRSIDLENHVVLNCPNCMDESYWYGAEQQNN